MPTANGIVHACRFERLLVGDRWERDIRIEVDGEGRIAAPGDGDPGDDCERVAGWTVPGVPNVHGHSFQRALAGLAEGRGPDSFWSWRKVMYRFLERLTPDDIEAITAQLYVELAKEGFTCVGEFHYLHRPPGGGAYDDPAEMSRRILAAARTAGMGLVHMPAVYQAGGFGGEPLTGSQRRFRMDAEGVARVHEALAPDLRGGGERLGWALHSLRAVPAETFERIAGYLDTPSGTSPGGAFGDRAMPVHIHVAEQAREVEECRARRGVRPVRWLLDNAPVDERWCLVHATHATRDELAAVARRGAVAGLCPTTEANLGDGFFPLGAFAGSGGAVRDRDGQPRVAQSGGGAAAAGVWAAAVDGEPVGAARRGGRDGGPGGRVAGAGVGGREPGARLGGGARGRGQEGRPGCARRRTSGAGGGAMAPPCWIRGSSPGRTARCAT